MRAQDTQQAALFSYLSPEQRVPATPPLRLICWHVDAAVVAWSSHLAALYAQTGRPSIVPEKLLRALNLRALLVTPHVA